MKNEKGTFFQVKPEFQMPISLVLIDIEYWLIAYFEGIALLCN